MFFIPSNRTTQPRLSFDNEDVFGLRFGVLDNEGVLQLWEWLDKDYCWMSLGKCKLIEDPEKISFVDFDSSRKYNNAIKHIHAFLHIYLFCFNKVTPIG